MIISPRLTFPLESTSVTLAVLVISTDGVTVRFTIVGSSTASVDGSSLVEVACNDIPAGVVNVPVTVAVLTSF